MHLALQLTLNFIKDREDGATAVEYALMVVLIALAIFGAVQVLGPILRDIFGDPQLNGAIN